MADPSPIRAEQTSRQIPRERFIFTSVQLKHSSAAAAGILQFSSTFVVVFEEKRGDEW